MIQATGTRYILTAEPMEHVSATGIYIKNYNDVQFARIHHAGPKVTDRLDAGTRVQIDWNRTSAVKHEGETYFVIDQDNINAVVEP